MKLTVAENDYFDRLILGSYTEDDFAHGHIETATGVHVLVPKIASLVYRGFGWTLTAEGEVTRLMPEVRP